jgi:hypothetical protein
LQETLLGNLQASIEKEEQKWTLRLNEKESLILHLKVNSLLLYI